MRSVIDDIKYGINDSKVIEIIDKKDAILKLEVDPSDILQASTVSNDQIVLENGTILRRADVGKSKCRSYVDDENKRYAEIRAYYGRKTFGGPKGLYTIYDIFDHSFIVGYALCSNIKNYRRIDGRGRPRADEAEKVVAKGIALKPSEWDKLKRESVDGSATKEAVRRIRASLQQSQ